MTANNNDDKPRGVDSVEYSSLVVELGKQLMRVAEGAESAADGDLEGTERDDAIARAREKLARYHEIMASLMTRSQVLAAQFKKRFASDIELIEESLARIDSKSRGT